MGEAKRRRDLISILIPERGRPAELYRLIDSLIRTGTGGGFEIIVAIDDDDPAWSGVTPEPKPVTRYIRRPRPITLGEKINLLAGDAGGDLLWWIANDQIVETEDWPETIRNAAALLPRGIGVLYPNDPTHPDHASYPIVTRALYRALGFIVPPPYPYWFIDTTVDEWGIMLDQRHCLDIEVASPDGRGRTHGLCDLEFWVSFYRALAPRRFREAIQLAAAAWGEGSDQFTAFMREAGRRQQLCAARVAHLASPAFLAEWGGRSDSPPSPDYPRVRGYAEEMMAELARQAPRRPRVAICVPSGRAWEATTANSIAALAAYSTSAGIEVAMLNVQTSAVTHGRNQTVKLALENACDWLMWVDSDMKMPPDTLVRLLAHGKDIVGATYNRRTPPYTTLGRLKGPAPAQPLRGGLHEAEALPGGMILVKADVYRKLGWPWYAECYRWHEDDGLEAFKALLRDYFCAAPPEEALAELDQTSLGAWLHTGNNIALSPDATCDYFSEDLFFVRKAIRHGYQVWCCLDTTFSVAHIGTQEVTCDRPPALAQALDQAAD